MLWLIVLLGALALGVIALIAMYNRLATLRVQVDNAWADIDVQLKRRHDLVPNVVETVKGYAAHERGTFEQVVEARNRAMSAQGPAAKAEAEGMLTQALKSVFALAEAYPDLKAIQSFTELQATLNEIEVTVANARRYYNAVVRDLNTLEVVFPSSIVAGMFGFRPREFFEAAAAEREVPEVRFDSGAAGQQ